MTIKWYDEAAAEKVFQTTFVAWASQYGYKGCYSAEHTRTALEATKAWALASPTAQEILRHVSASSKEIHVVGMIGGYQCFNSTEGADLDLPVVFIDLDGQLTVNVRTAHNLHLDPSACTGNTIALDNRVALLHEFGHAKQWIETPAMFDNSPGNFDARLGKSAFAAEIQAKAAARLARSTCPRCGELVELDKVTKAMLNPDRDRVKHPKALHICQGSKSSKAIAPAAIIATAEEVQPFNEKTNPDGYKPPVWGAKIEMDNMARHEWPVCTELGLGQRVNYRDINVTSDGAPSQTSQIRRMALAEQKKNAALKEVILAPGTVKCPYCAFTKSRMFVNNHIKLNHLGKALLE